jgi:hypothetical protein
MLPPGKISPPFSPSSRPRVFGWLLHLNNRSAAVQGHDVFFFSSLSLPPPTMVRRPPHTFRPGRAPSSISLLPRTPTFGWLLCYPTKRWPLKAANRSLSLFTDGLHFGDPSEGLKSGKSAPDASHHQRTIGSSSVKIWVHGGCCHGERGSKPLKGRTAAAHVGCCVLWLCFVLWLVVSRAPYFTCFVE